MNKAIFLDRDGVCVKDVDNFDHKNKIVVLPGVPEALHLLTQAGFLEFIVTNQPVVARGILTEKQVEKINTKIVQMISSGGGRIVKSYFCPHHPNATLEPYRKLCDCRKPQAGMLFQAAKEYSVDLPYSYMVGDMPSDITTGRNAGCKTILIKSPANHKIIQTGKPFERYEPDYRFDNLLEAARFLTQ